jgi:hypothetical protein
MGSTLMAAILLGLGWSSMGGKPARPKRRTVYQTVTAGLPVITLPDLLPPNGWLPGMDIPKPDVTGTPPSASTWVLPIPDLLGGGAVYGPDPNYPDDLDNGAPYVRPKATSDPGLGPGTYIRPQISASVKKGVPFNANDYIGVGGGDDRSGTIDRSQETLWDYAWRSGTEWFTEIRGLW